LLPFHQRLKARLPDGVLGLVYLGVYAVGRFFLSFYRTDPAVFAGLRQAQLASLLMVAIAAVAIPFLFRRARTAGKPTVEAPSVDSQPSAVAQPVPASESTVEEAGVDSQISAIAEPDPATQDRASDRHEPRRATRPPTPPPQSTT